MSVQKVCCRSKQRSAGPGVQRGAALIVGLILLLILTMIGVAGMRDTLLQERMAGSSRDRQLALQAAEAALRAAETQIADGASYDAGSIGATLRQATDFPRKVSSVVVSETKYWEAYDWSAGATAYTDVGTATGLKTNPQYVIERLPCTYSKVPGSYNILPTANTLRVTDYRVTARANGMSDKVEVVLQSVFRRTDTVATSIICNN